MPAIHPCDVLGGRQLALRRAVEAAFASDVAAPSLAALDRLDEAFYALPGLDEFRLAFIGEHPEAFETDG